MDNSFLKKVFHKHSPEEEKVINKVKEDSIIYKLINNFKLKLNPETGRYDCDGNVDLSGENLTEIPIKFGKIGGDFNCSYNELESLEGAPTYVGGDFGCSSNELKSLEGAPKEVGGDFDCSRNELESLGGSPTEVGGSFYCSRNELESLGGSPTEVGGSFNCARNKLKSLEGAPKKVGRHFYCNGNQLKSLEGAPTYVGGDFYCYNNELKSLEGAPTYVGGDFDCSRNELESLGGSPTEVGGDFNCFGNPVRFTEEDVRKVCDVGGGIFESKSFNKPINESNTIKKFLKKRLKFFSNLSTEPDAVKEDLNTNNELPRSGSCMLAVENAIKGARVNNWLLT